MNAINNDQENEVSKKKIVQYQPFRAMQQTAANMSVIIQEQAANHLQAMLCKRKQNMQDTSHNISGRDFQKLSESLFHKTTF